MSSVIAGTMSKPSRAHNFAHIIFGYTVAFSLISQSQFDSSSDYLVLVGITGGFIGTFLFFIKPIEKIILALESRHPIIFWRNGERSIGFSTLFASPYLTETKGKIVGGIYFFLVCLTTSLFNPNLADLAGKNIWLVRGFLLFIGSVVVVISFFELRRLNARVDTLAYYYTGIEDRRFPEKQIQIIREALNRGDWAEASLLIQRREAPT